MLCTTQYVKAFNLNRRIVDQLDQYPIILIEPGNWLSDPAIGIEHTEHISYIYIHIISVFD